MKLASILKDRINTEHQKTLKQLLVEVLEQYLNIKLKPKLKSLIENYLIYLQSAKSGELVDGFEWPDNIRSDSPELLDLLNYVLLREQAMKDIPSPLLSQSQYIVAGQGFSAQALFEQSCRLEKCLNNNEIAESQTKAIADQITNWGAELYNKFAEMIFDAKDETELSKKFDAAFDPSHCTKLEIMTLVYGRLRQSCSFLERNNFLTEFYSHKTLHEKYDFVYEYSLRVQHDSSLTVETRSIIEHLDGYIPGKAYQTCQRKRLALISDIESAWSVEEVHTKLSAWSSRLWRRHKDKDETTALFDELNNMLQADRKHLKAWESVAALQTPISRKRTAYEVFAYRYGTSDPDADPHALLKKLQPVIRVPSDPQLDSLSELLLTPEEKQNDDDATVPIRPYTPAADSIIVRPGNPLSIVLDNLPSLTDLYGDEPEPDSKNAPINRP